MPPSLRTPRLLLRPFCADDAAALAERRSDPEVARYVLWNTPYTMEQAHSLIEKSMWRGHVRPGEGVQIVMELPNGQAAGDLAVMAQPDDIPEMRQAMIGFTVARAHQGQGYATEAARAVVEALFRGGIFSEHPIHRISAICDVENVASRRVLERLGMRRESHLVENIFFKGAWGSEYTYGILRREWDSRLTGAPDHC
ncbi:MAG: GNAT family N-acetyltransferase [Phycisphaerales bacterium]|nr:GNAT family N-acetyltransferase [Phycisphaerales bacterium]